MNSFRTFALIPAAGMGKRMGASINKQYLTIGGRPILSRTIERFEKSPRIDGIFLVIPEEEMPYCRANVVESGEFRKILAIVPGGRERSDSVMNGLLALLKTAEPDDLIMIHDGVRPFVTEKMIEESVNAAAASGGAVVAVPAKDTIKVVESGIITSTPERKILWQAQTPQTFRFGIIFDAYRKGVASGVAGTDDSSFVEQNGGKVTVIPGDYRNIKITTPEDLLLAEAFLASDISLEE